MRRGHRRGARTGALHAGRTPRTSGRSRDSSGRSRSCPIRSSPSRSGRAFPFPSGVARMTEREQAGMGDRRPSRRRAGRRGGGDDLPAARVIEGEGFDSSDSIPTCTHRRDRAIACGARGSGDPDVHARRGPFRRSRGDERVADRQRGLVGPDGPHRGRTGRACGGRGADEHRDRDAPLSSVHLVRAAAQRGRANTEASFLCRARRSSDGATVGPNGKRDARQRPLPGCRGTARAHVRGAFRSHMIVKGRNRDTAWFSMLDSRMAVATRLPLRVGRRGDGHRLGFAT